MKSLSLSRPLVIMMLGVPGAGKSFFARQFSDTFGAPLVSHDRLRYELFSDPQFNKDEEMILDRLTLLQAKELLKTHKTFIIDGSMSVRTNRAIIEKLARDEGYGTLVVWVQTDPQTSQARSLKRNPNRPFDEYNSALSVDTFVKLSKRVSPPAGREPYIVISGKHTFATQAKVVLRKLVSGRDGEAPAVVTPITVAPQIPEQDYPDTPTRRSVTIR